ncbi:MAG: RseA family anti-sigma factor [Rhodoferax sp.]
MNNEQEQSAMQTVSDLMDGRLRGQPFARAVEWTAADAGARAAWRSYHLVGEVLRSGSSAAVVNDSAFAGKVAARLVSEQIAIKNVASDVDLERAKAQIPGLTAGGDTSANAPSFRWKLVAGLASFAAVAAISWNLTAPLRVPDGAQMAAAPLAPAQVAKAEPVEPQVMIRDPHLDALMAAHKQFGGTSALQMPAGFLRNATFEGPSR